MNSFEGACYTESQGPDPTTKGIKIKEFKYTGYQYYSKFIASDNDFLVFRRFSSLKARVALALQDEIVLVEQELAALDRASSKKTTPDIHNGSFRLDAGSRRSTLLRGNIYHKLKEHNEFMFHQSQLANRPPIPAKDVKSLGNWHHNHTNAIQAKEAAYIAHPHDLFSLVPKKKSPLRKLFEKSLHFRLFRLWRVEGNKDLETNLSDTERELNISDDRIDGFISVIIASVGLVMLIAPLWILEFTESSVVSLGWITGFGVLFLGLLSYATVAKPFEVLGATAAYSAVLMVFLQIGK